MIATFIVGIVNSMEILCDDYNLWRSLIAMAHVDGRLIREETNFLEENIKAKAPDKYHQRLIAEIRSELFRPKPAEKFFTKIKKSSQKVALLELANDLFMADNHIDIRERNELDKLIEFIRKDETAMTILRNEMLRWERDEKSKMLRLYIEDYLKEKGTGSKDTGAFLLILCLLVILGVAAYLGYQYLWLFI